MNVKVSMLLVVLLLAVSAGCNSQPTPEEDLSKFDGEWTVVELNDKGKQADDKAMKRIQLSFQGGKFNKLIFDATKMTNAEEATVRADSTKTPAHIDLVHLKGDEQGKPQLGIFVLEGDKLKMCLADIGADRPTQFVAGGTSTLMVLERKK